jgi:C-terminal processing protease CtpA/Prc
MSSLITATVVKEDRSSKLGIAFEREGEGKALKIKLIRDDSLFAGSELVPGMIVVKAAGIDMIGKSPKDAADAMRGAPGGEEIDLVCKATFSTAAKIEAAKKPGRLSFRRNKKTTEEPPKLGISFKSSTAQPGKIFVSNIKEDSKFAGTPLEVGHQVVAINGIPVPETVTEAVALLKKEQGDMTEDLVLTTINPEDEVAPILEKAEDDAAAADPSTTTDVVEEKKEDFPAEDASPSSPKSAAAEEEDTTPEANKPLLDSMFAWCIC